MLVRCGNLFCLGLYEYFGRSLKGSSFLPGTSAATLGWWLPIKSPTNTGCFKLDSIVFSVFLLPLGGEFRRPVPGVVGQTHQRPRRTTFRNPGIRASLLYRRVHRRGWRRQRRRRQTDDGDGQRQRRRRVRNVIELFGSNMELFPPTTYEFFWV